MKKNKKTTDPFEIFFYNFDLPIFFHIFGLFRIDLSKFFFIIRFANFFSYFRFISDGPFEIFFYNFDLPIFFHIFILEFRIDLSKFFL